MRTEQRVLEALVTAVSKVLEHDVHMDHCAETLMGNGNGPCDCPAKQLRAAFSECLGTTVSTLVENTRSDAETDTILNLANYKLPDDPVLEAHGINIIHSGLGQLMEMRSVLLALAPFVAVLSRAPNVSPSAREELLKIEPKMLQVLTFSKQQAEKFDELTKKSAPP